MEMGGRPVSVGLRLRGIGLGGTTMKFVQLNVEMVEGCLPCIESVERPPTADDLRQIVPLLDKAR
jgi:hypothetical protein